MDKATRRALVYGVAVAVVMIAQQLAGKALRDAFFLSHFEASTLPPAMMVAAVLSLGAVLGTTQLFRKMAPAKVVPFAFLISSAWFLGEWALSYANPQLASISLYLHTTSFGAVVVSGFWSVVNERFDPHTAKRVIGPIASGATAGGVLGGLAAWQGSQQLSISVMILALAVMSAFCGFGVWRLARSSRSSEAPPASKPPPVLAIMDETPYLWHVALLVAVSALGASAFDYVFKARAAAAFESSDELVSFFALFYLGLGIATFVFQNLVATRALHLLGLTATVASMPAAVVVLGTVALLFGGLGSVIALRGGAAVLESSLYRSGYELLYTPLTPAKKRSTKALIDVGLDKIGAAAGSAVALVIIALFPVKSESLLLGLSVVCGGAALVVTRYLHRGYVTSLAESLQRGAVAAETLGIADATTQRAVERTMANLERSAFRTRTEGGTGRIQPRNPRSVRHAQSPSAREMQPPFDLETGLTEREIDEVLRSVAALRSAAPARVRAVLRRYQPLPQQLVVYAVPLLRVDALRDELLVALQRVAAVNIGLLGDSLVSERTPHEVRRFLPRIFEQVATQPSADTLTRALKTDSFEIRFRSASALKTIVSRNRALAVDRPRIEEAVLRVLFEARIAHPSIDAEAQEPIGRALTYAFILLSTILPAEPLRLALEAVADPTPARRGTGREYLENILPVRVKEGLLRLLKSPSAAERACRDQGEVAEELGTRHDEARVDLRTLIRRFEARDRAQHRPPRGESSMDNQSKPEDPGA